MNQPSLITRLAALSRISKKFHTISNASQQSCRNTSHIPKMYLGRIFVYGKCGFKTMRSSSMKPEDAQGIANSTFNLLRRPFLFTVAVCGFSFCGSMVWQYERLRHIFYINRDTAINGVVQKTGPKSNTLRNKINIWWNSFSPGKKMVMGIIAANFGVYLLWWAPVCYPMLSRYFLSSPTSSAPCLSMLLSTFSHKDLFHIAANMYVLWSFSNIALNLFGREQFLAVYLSAGVFSTFASYVVKVLRTNPMSSLGASGALMAVIGAVCTTYPDARLSIVLIGQLFNFSFTADTALKTILVVDAVGVMMGWKMFDHAAHLGGLLFGIWYVKYGRYHVWARRESLIRKWHELRGKP